MEKTYYYMISFASGQYEPKSCAVIGYSSGRDGGHRARSRMSRLCPTK